MIKTAKLSQWRPSRVMKWTGLKWAGLKWLGLILLMWVILLYFYPSWQEVETLEHMRAMQRRHKDRLGWEHKTEDEERPHKRNPNSLDDDLEKPGKNGYRNSKTLREQLRPRLAKPVAALDESGDVVWNDIGVAKSTEDIAIREEGYKKFAFNSLVSQRIGYRRDVPDTRHPECHKNSYPEDLPVASIVICYYHEELMTLLRTVYSVVDRTPSRYLKEIILVNDWSDIDIRDNLTDHIHGSKELTSVVRVVTPPERLGLIRARIFGSRQATGDVLVFLDSHVEVNQQWLEPLLARVKEARTNVVTPIIDIISADTFKYEPSPLVRGGFNWGLNFKWDPITRAELKNSSDFAKPMRSPTMAGGLFAMDRKYFTELGEYDPGLDVWGGENLELSFRVWMCGGTLEIIPCARVGHVFRKRRPYGASEQDSMVRNSLRVAHVWMDEYIENYFRVNPDARNVHFGDVSIRRALRERLGCKSFKWFLDTIYPDFDQSSTAAATSEKKKHGQVRYEPWNRRSRNYVRSFTLRLVDSQLCVRSLGDPDVKKSELVLAPCLRSSSFIWSETDKGELVLSQLLCLDSSAKTRVPRLMKCHELRGDQEWKFRDEAVARTAIYNMAAGLCLGIEGRRTGAKLIMDVCSSDQSEIWELREIDDELK